MNYAIHTRLLSVLLAVVMVVGMLPVAALATEDTQTAATEVTQATEAATEATEDAEETQATEAEEVTEATQATEAEAAQTAYTVEHWLWNAEENEYVLQETEEKTGIAGELTAAEVKSFEGYVPAQEIQQVQIAADGTTVVVIRYDLVPEKEQTAVYLVEHWHWDADAGEFVLFETEEKTGIPGELTAAEAKNYEGFAVRGGTEQVPIAADGTTVVAYYYMSMGPASQAEEPYYNILSQKTYNLAPGATETEMILNNDEGTRRQIIHVFEVDPTHPDIQVIPGYYQIDKLDPDNLSDSTYWSAMQLTQTVAYYENQLNLNVVGAMNTALAYDSSAPYDFMVWNGVVLADPANHPGGNAQTYLAIYRDGTCELRSRTEPLDGNEWNVVSANFNFIVRDGELVNKNVSRGTGASRSMIGIKADGSLVFCQTDGRMGVSVAEGLSDYEEGELMLSLGCVNAVNCDGGGSSTFVSKRAGETSATMRSIPSDGSERATINSVMIVSTAKATGEFDSAVVEADFDYVAPGASFAVSATGVDAAGGQAEIPEDARWTVSNADYGTIQNGVFTAASDVVDVDVDIQLVHGGKVVGSKTVRIVHPATFGFAADKTVVPYGKTITLDIVALYGADNWNVAVDGAYGLALSDDDAAKLEGDKLTASSDESVKGVDVVVTYIPDNAKTDTLTVEYGKGSEILYDFEDKDISQWMGFDEAKQWSLENGVKNTLVGSSPLEGQYSDETDGHTTLSSAASGGQVKNGDYALAWHVDNTNAAFANWTYNILFNISEEPIVLRDVANGKNATSLGMWLYIPEGAAGMAFQAQLYTITGGVVSHVQAHYTFTTANGTVKNLNSCTEADIPESRWVYASISLTGWDYVSMPVATNESSPRSPSFVRTYIKPTVPAVHTFYIDDITLDYSSAVEDRVLPVISGTAYTTADESVALAEGAVVNGNTIAFSAKVSDNAGLNYSTGRILLDGVPMPGVTCSGNVLASGSAAVNSGVHTVTFEVRDTLGNLAKATRTFTVAGDSVITLTGHNDSGKNAEYDSIYYIDLVAAEIEKVDSITTTLKLQTANNWETAGITAAAGFTATAAYNEQNGLLTVTVERAGGNSLTGNQTLVSIPVRVWSWDAINHITGEVITPAAQFATGNCPIVTIDCDVVKGQAVFAGGESRSFGGTISVATNLNDTANPWHTHTASDLADQAPTCTEAGFSGRTYCHVCQSVLSWGTTEAATGHSFSLTDGLVQCACGELLNGEWTDGKTYVDGALIQDGWHGELYYVDGVKLTGIQLLEDAYYQFGEDGVSQGRITGLFALDGHTYYAINGKRMGGWRLIENEWYHFNVSTYTGYNGTYSQAYFGLDEALEYTFENGRLLSGVWVENAKGVRYYYGPSYYTGSWQTIDGAKYYFNDDGARCTGYTAITANKNDATVGYQMYLFGEDGKLLETLTSTGILHTDAASYYLQDGIVARIGLVKVDGAYYYFSTTSGVMYKNGTRYIAADCIHESAAGVSAGTYTFGADGKMDYQEPEETPDVPDVPEEKKNGIVGDYYYVDDVIQKVGLIKVDGAYYYFSTTNGVMYKNGTRYVAQDCITHESVQGVPAGTYTFDAQGRMDYQAPEEVPDVPDVPVEKKNGIIGDYYYVDDVIQKVGLIRVDGDVYYFSTTNGVMSRNKTRYVAQDCITHESVRDLKAGEYTFGADGKMVVEQTEEPDVPDVPVEKKNGIIGNYYYVDDVIQKVGLIRIDGDVYYFSTTDGTMNRSKTRYVAQDCIIHESVQDLKAGMYTFGADGKMVVEQTEEPDVPDVPVEKKNGIIGNYYYVDDVIQKVGLIKVDGAYYYFSTTNGAMYKSGTRYVAQDCITHESVQGMKANIYTFGADGKMVIEETKNGIIGSYYYVDGVIQKVGLIKVDGAYYYFSTTNGAMYKNGTRYVAQDCITHESVQGVKAGMFTFGADGKMVI